MPTLGSERLLKSLQRRTEQYAYSDTAIYYAPKDPEIVDEYGQPNETITGVIVSCSYSDRADRTTWEEEVDIENLGGQIRVKEITPEKGGTFTVTKRWGSDDTSQAFEIIDIRDRGEFGYLCLLRASGV